VTQILIEENFRHIDGQDMERLIETLADLGLDADPTQPRTPERHGRWVLVLHWLGDSVQPLTDDAFAARLADTVRQVFQEQRPAELAPALQRTPPSRIDIHAAHSGAMLGSITVGDAP
jgi:hypothetical protein